MIHAQLCPLMDLLSLYDHSEETPPATHADVRAHLGLVAAHADSQFVFMHDAATVAYLDVVTGTTALNRDVTALIGAFVRSEEIHALRYHPVQATLPPPLIALISAYEFTIPDALREFCKKTIEDNARSAVPYFQHVPSDERWIELEERITNELEALPPRRKVAIRYFAERIVNHVALVTEAPSRSEARLQGFGLYLAACDVLFKRETLVNDLDAIAPQFLDRVAFHYLAKPPLCEGNFRSEVEATFPRREPQFIAKVPVREII